MSMEDIANCYHVTRRVVNAVLYKYMTWEEVYDLSCQKKTIGQRIRRKSSNALKTPDRVDNPPSERSMPISNT